MECQDGKTFSRNIWFMRSEDAPQNYDDIIEKLSQKGYNNGIEAVVLDGIISTITQLDSGNRNGVSNYLLPLGVTTYNDLFDSEYLHGIEEECDKLHKKSCDGKLPKECFHSTWSRKGILKRTKYFFGSRYLWHRDQLASPEAKIANGIRNDVPLPPKWMTV